MVFAAKRRGRVCSGAALAVLVALVALALFSCVDAQSIIGRADKLRDRVESVVAVLCDSSEVDCGRNDLRRSVLKLALRKNFEDGFRLRGRRKLAQFDVQRVLGRADRLRESVGSALESLRSEMAGHAAGGLLQQLITRQVVRGEEDDGAELPNFTVFAQNPAFYGSSQDIPGGALTGTQDDGEGESDTSRPSLTSTDADTDVGGAESLRESVGSAVTALCDDNECRDFVASSSNYIDAITYYLAYDYAYSYYWLRQRFPELGK